jgi:ABC-type Mn2+/Zn2+ transport system ATPase subunit
MSMALEIHNLSKRYGRKWALRDCTVSLPAGHVVALVGPNGALVDTRTDQLGHGKSKSSDCSAK